MSTKTKVGSLIAVIIAFSLIISSCGEGPGLPLNSSNGVPVNPTSSATPRSPAGSSSEVASTTIPASITQPASQSTTQTNISLDIELPSLLETAQGMTFKAKPDVPLTQIPQNTAWLWDFGDDTAPVTQVGRTEAYLNAGHVYARNGEYQIRLSLIDRTTKKEYASTIKDLVINDSASLRKTNHAKIIVRLNGDVSGNGPGQGWLVNDEAGFTATTFGGEYSNLSPTLFEWAGERSAGWGSMSGDWRGQENDFIGTLKITSTKSEEEINKSFAGTVAITPDGISLKTGGCDYSLYYPNYEGSGKLWHIYEDLTLNDVPLTKLWGGDYPKYYCLLQGESVVPYVVGANSSEFFPNGQENTWNYMWVDTLPPIEIEITFDRLK